MKVSKNNLKIQEIVYTYGYPTYIKLETKPISSTKEDTLTTPSGHILNILLDQTIDKQIVGLELLNSNNFIEDLSAVILKYNLTF